MNFLEFSFQLSTFFLNAWICRYPFLYCHCFYLNSISFFFHSKNKFISQVEKQQHLYTWNGIVFYLANQITLNLFFFSLSSSFISSFALFFFLNIDEHRRHRSLLLLLLLWWTAYFGRDRFIHQKLCILECTKVCVRARMYFKVYECVWTSEHNREKKYHMQADREKKKYSF